MAAPGISTDLKVGNLSIIFVLYVTISHILAPMIGFYTLGREGLIWGYVVGLAIILVLWILVGKKYI